MGWLIFLGTFFLLLGLYDVLQRRRAILHNFPIIGHLRYLLESFGPELRQYIVTGNNDERPFSRHQRRWVYASSKKENNYFGFGTDRDLESVENHLIFKPAVFPHEPDNKTALAADGWPIPCAKVLGGYRQRKKAFRPKSAVNISGMSFGSLSSSAVEALNRGARLANCLQATGEGGLSSHHQHGGELVWQIGTGYFGCRDEHGKFSLSRFKDVISASPVRAIEIKLSQGAKSGLGGVLPAIKISEEIAKVRGVPMGKDCISPARHSAFQCVDSLLDFVEKLADESGLPIGIKSAVGDLNFWKELATKISATSRAVDFITIDGGEGGTGAGPLVFADHVALPFKIGFAQVYREFAQAGLQDKIVFTGSGKLGFPESALLAFALGCDTINVGREALLALGCIQAQRCHTNHCPTGVATQNKWLMKGLDPTLKSVRLANYITTLRKEILSVTWACGVSHPAFMSFNHIAILDGKYQAHSGWELFQYKENWGLPFDKKEIPVMFENSSVMGTA